MSRSADLHRKSTTTSPAAMGDRFLAPRSASGPERACPPAVSQPPQVISFGLASAPPLAGSAGRPDLAVGARRSLPRQHRKRSRPAVYRNPLRAINGLVPERVDMGADFACAGPVCPLGKAIITNASGDSSGWPGGGWITCELTTGPARGLQVYVAGDVRPVVRVGQRVTSATVIARCSTAATGSRRRAARAEQRSGRPRDLAVVLSAGLVRVAAQEVAAAACLRAR